MRIIQIWIWRWIVCPIILRIGWVGQKEPALRSWKHVCILYSSNFQTSVKNLPKLQHAGKRPSSASSSLNSSILTKKKKKLSVQIVWMFLKHLLGVIFHPLSNMKILSLNCQGLGILEVCSRTVEELHCLAREKCPKILFFVWNSSGYGWFFLQIKEKIGIDSWFCGIHNWIWRWLGPPLGG